MTTATAHASPEASESNESHWDVEKAAELYKIDRWGLGYFTVKEDGNLCVKPSAASPYKVDLKMLVDQLRQRKVNTPVLIRLMDILKDRIARLSDCFRQAIELNDYRGQYSPIFPIKVNQERDVVSAILNYGKNYGLGLEAGSKAELLIVLALTVDPQTPIICNGYKDQEFVELTAMAHKMGKRIFPVIENYDEIETFIAHYKRSGVMPHLGMRIKLSTKGSGKWASTGGDASKFGLRIPEVMRVISRLKEEGLLDSLKLLHFHIGSQITKIKVVKQAIVETARVYLEIMKLGAKMEYIDIGGGLGVDYGSSVAGDATINYTLEEYAGDIIYRIKQLCDENGVEHPCLFSESGRFLAAHYSLLVTDVPATSSVLDGDPELPPPPKRSYGPVEEMYQILESLKDQNANLVECYHDAVQYKSEALNLFSLGYLSLPERANMEAVFWKIMREIIARTKTAGGPASELDLLAHQVADTYFANFSLFQSLPDSWAIEQIFPVIPIHRLDERPDRLGIIADLTCDSDGLIDSYVGDEEQNVCLPLHAVRKGEAYYIGIFLIGAYQETLGELHNLFGDTHAVQVDILGEDRYKIRHLIKGDTIHQVIGYVSYSSRDLIHKMREQIETAVASRKLSLDESASLMDLYEEGLHGYTYFEE